MQFNQVGVTTHEHFCISTARLNKASRSGRHGRDQFSLKPSTINLFTRGRNGKNCDERNRRGFQFNESEADLFEALKKSDLRSTKILNYHSWIAEYANIRWVNIKRGRVGFNGELTHAPLGKYGENGGWRYFVPTLEQNLYLYHSINTTTYSDLHCDDSL